MIHLNWSDFKAMIDKTGAQAFQVSYVELSSYYIIWTHFQGMKIIVPHCEKGSPCSAEFEATLKTAANQSEAERVRITTNKLGRRLHDRYITFVTGTTDGSFDNTDWKNRDFGDLVYKLRDAGDAFTLDGDQAVETWLDWEPPFDFEISGGWVCVPDVLPGDENAWEIHVVGVPDIPASYGGEISFICNPRLKWIRGQRLNIDASLNPAEMKYNATLHTNKLRFVIKHPLGAKCEMQLNIKVFK